MSIGHNIRHWRHIIFLVIAYFFIVGFFQFLGMLVIGVDVNDYLVKRTSEEDVVISFFGFFGTFLVLVLFMKIVDREPFANLGFQLQNRTKDIVMGIVMGLLAMGIGYTILLFVNEIDFTRTILLIREFLLTVLIFLLVAFMEEALFRGYVLRNLMGAMEKYMALAISAGVFALMHGINPNITWVGLINLFLAGILLGLPYIHTKNLWFPIALHFSWNFFQSFFGFNVSGQDAYSFIEFSMDNKTVINGGDFGFEGSVLSVMIQVILIIMLFYYFEHKKLHDLKI